MTKFFRKITKMIPMMGIFLQRYFVALDLAKGYSGLILDLGCGEGTFSDTLVRCGKKVVAIDVDKTNLKRNFLYILARAEHLPFKNSSFNQIFCLDVLEHVRNDILAAKEMSRTLKKKGSLVLTTTSDKWRFPYFNLMKKLCPSERFLLKFFGHVRIG